MTNGEFKEENKKSVSQQTYACKVNKKWKYNAGVAAICYSKLLTLLQNQQFASNIMLVFMKILIFVFKTGSMSKVESIVERKSRQMQIKANIYSRSR